MKKITLSLLALFVTCCVWQTSAQYMLDQAGTFAPIDISATGTNVTLGDDAVVADLPIGFTFNFYGNDYTDFDIASNGLMMFDGNGDNGCCSGEPLPIISASEPINFIAFAWEDLDPGNGGQPAVNVIRYATTGAAPNRILVMEFFNVDHFPSGNNVTTQVHLFETSNDIEIHTTAMPSDGGNHTMGIQNVDGSQSLAVPGRNGVDWSATNDYVRFFLPPPPPPPSDDACGVGLPAAFDPPSIISSDATITQTGVVGAAAGEYNLDFVSFDATSNWPNDITLTLTAPDGTTTITLSDGNGPGNAPGTEMDTEFRDDSANDVTAWSSGDMLADYQAEGGLLNTVFAGQPIDGVWTLTLDDVCCNDGGTWDEWCIEFTQNGVPPIIACPSDVMANSDPGECGAIVNFATPGAIDPEGGSVTVTQTMGPATGSLFPIGDTIVEFTATNDDAPNETATCQFTVTVVDNEAPTITCPADITQTNDPGVCGANITVPMPTIMDNCPVMANNPPPSVQGPVTDFIFDAAGLADTPTTLVGTQMSTGGDVTMSVSFNGDFGGSFEAFILNGPDGTEVYNNQDVLSDCGGPFNFEFTIAEADWNNYVTTFGPDLTFTLLADPDVDGPALCAPDNFYQLAAEQGMATGPTLTNDYNGTNDASGFYPVGDTDVTFTYTDGAGNSASCTMTVTVTDDEAPVVVCEGGAGTFTVTEDFDAGLPAGWSSVINSGTCDFMNVSTVPIGADFSNYPAMVFDDDACGNGAPASNVSILSDIYDTSGSSTITLEYEYGFYEFSGGETFTVEVWDGAAWQQVAQYAADTDPTVETVDASAFANADFQVRWTFDDNGAWGWYAGMDSFSLTYDVLAGPPFDVVLDANGMATVDISDLVMATDNCGNTTATTNVTGTVNNSITTVFDSNNGLGGGSAVYFDVTVGVNDISITDLDLNTGDPGAFTVEMYTLVGTYVGNEQDPAPWTLSATGSGTASGTVNVPSNAVLDAPVTLTANTTYGVALVLDASHGHSYSGIGGDPSPGMLMYSNADVTLNLGASAATPFSSTPFSPRIWNGTLNYTVDSTNPVPVTSIEVTCDDVGESQIEVTVTDDAGNTSVCTATINVIDDTAPVVVCQDFTLELGPDGTAMLDPFDLIDMTATFEACGIDTAAVDIDDFSCDDIGTPIEVTLFVADPSLNTAACTAMVTVVDLLAPEVTCPADQTVDPGPNNQLYEVPDYFATGEATALDNCTDPVTIFTQDPAAGALIGDGTYTVTLTAEDEYGNIGTCTFELTVESVLGVEESSLEAGVTMYPNPAQAEVTIANNSNILLEKATMYDVNGKLVNTTDLSDMTTEKTIDISQLASGVYIVQIESENASVVKRLIKE